MSSPDVVGAWIPRKLHQAPSPHPPACPNGDAIVVNVEASASGTKEGAHVLQPKDHINSDGNLISDLREIGTRIFLSDQEASISTSIEDHASSKEKCDSQSRVRVEGRGEHGQSETGMEGQCANPEKVMATPSWYAANLEGPPHPHVRAWSIPQPVISVRLDVRTTSLFMHKVRFLACLRCCMST